MRRLWLVPFALGFITALGMLFDGRNEQIYFRIAVISAAFATAVSTWITSREFAPSDRLFAAWILIGCGYGIAGLRYLLRLAEVVVPGFKLNETLVEVMVAFQWGFKTVALIIFVLAWKAAGLPEPGSRAVRALLSAASAVIAILVGAFPLIRVLRSEVLELSELSLFVGTAGSMIGVVLIVPLAVAALAMRGGLLMHAWIYLAGSQLVWLVYDVSLSARPVLAPQSDFLWGIEEGLRVTAVLFVFIASVAQRRAFR